MWLAQQQIRKAQLFFNRYEFDTGSPMYKSETSLVYFADDYSDAEKREVVLKFVYSLQDLKSELNARNVGKFHDNYVISVIRHHNGDEDHSFLEAVEKSKNQLSSYCIVLQRGERNLLAQINAMSIFKKRRTEEQSMNEVRNRGEELAKCLEEVHKKRFIHGDFKLKNVVLDAKSDKWKLIDFDCSVNYEEATELRGKISTPPDTEGYSTTLRRDWVDKYGPALLVTLRVLQVACAVGRLAGLPLPNIQDVRDMTADLLSDHAGALSTMYNSLREELGDVGDLLESKVEDFVDIPSAPSDIGGLSAAENAVQRSYGEIMEIAKQAGDPELEKLEERCGLVRAYKSDQSTSAYVRKDAAQVYARLGDKAFHKRRRSEEGAQCNNSVK
jgi:serine/threonine protein kinase